MTIWGLWGALSHAVSATMRKGAAVQRGLFCPLTEIRRAGIAVRTAEIDWFAWEPIRRRVSLGDHLSIEQKRCALALALAHRALGHWGNSIEQDVEARELAARWLLPREDLIRDAIGAVGLDPWLVAEHLCVTLNALSVRLGMVCRHITNRQLFAGEFCDCRV